MGIAAERRVVGVDFGTLSARAVVVDVADGRELGTAVAPYTSGVMDTTLASTGVALPPDWALQDPQDYIDALATAVRGAIADAGVDTASVIGIATDFTACTMVPTLADGTPLCQVDGWADRPHAYVKLWKHHAAQPYADLINATAAARDEPWLARYGGLISAEWEFAKGLELFHGDPELYAAMDRWVEAADWITWQLCGRYVRNTCTAGYKGILQDGAYPSRDFLAALDAGFAGFVDDKLDQPLGRLGDRAGDLTAAMAGRLGLPAGIAVAVGNVDAHATAPAAGVVEPGRMVAIMGTSTCHVVNGLERRDVAGMCGVVDGGIVDGLWGYEAGQSGVGDIFAWFVDNAAPAEVTAAAANSGVGVHEHLSDLAAEEVVGEHGLVALDWLNGNRSVLVDHELSGVIVGLTLATKPASIYRALLESTAFGARTIVDAFTSAGVPVDEFIVAGGLTGNGLLMQIYADVLRRPLSVIASDQGPALGSAIHAAVAAGAYADVTVAAKAMGGLAPRTYEPIGPNADRYDELFAHYTALHDRFGRGADTTMRQLRQIRRRALDRSSG